MASVNAFGDSLLKIVEKGIKCDSWGQRLEAAAEYKRVHMEYHEGMTTFAMDDETEKKLQKIMKNIRKRSEQLQNSNLNVSTKDVSLEEIKKDYEDLLLPIPKRKSQGKDGTYLTIKIDKIGLKDAHTYVDPFISVSVKDSEGSDLTGVQHTPASYHVADKYLVYDMNVHIQKALEELPEDFAIFLEFKHYKEDKDKVSTRCYAFVEKDEIKEGTATVELYKKPVDYKRKKLYLFTEKPLYLHLYYTLEKAS